MDAKPAGGLPAEEVTGDQFDSHAECGRPCLTTARGPRTFLSPAPVVLTQCWLAALSFPSRSMADSAMTVPGG